MSVGIEKGDLLGREQSLLLFTQHVQLMTTP